MTPWLRAPYAVAAGAAGMLASVVPAGAGSRSKLARSFSARKHLVDRYTAWGRAHRDRDRPLVWLHAASVGEALMAAPIAERLRRGLPAVQIAFTFFSPSAESLVRGQDADFTDYLPFDSRRAARAALDALAPTTLIFSKSDVWPNLASESRARGVRLGLISASMPEHSRRASRLGALLTRDAYHSLDAVGAASAADARALVRAGARDDAVRVTGDTRYDQAWVRAHAEPRNGPLVETLRTGRPTIVAGSTWAADEQHLLPAWQRLRREFPGLRLVIAPHEVRERRIAALTAALTAALSVADAEDRSAARVAALNDPAAHHADVVIVNRVGLLPDLYALATVAYVGGGFHTAGLHSLVEPAVFRVPTVTGPRYRGSRDAVLMLHAGGVLAVRDADGMYAAMRAILLDSEHHAAMSSAMGAVVTDELGAADRSFEIVRELLRPV